MLHLVPQPQFTEAEPQPYAEAVARLSGIRHVLRLVDPCGGGPAGDAPDDAAIGAAWESADPAKRRCFEERSGRVIAATAAGVEALLAETHEGREPNPAASARLAEEIRAGLEDISQLMLGTPRLPRPRLVAPDSLPFAL